MVLGSETPVNEWKNRLFFIVYCPKDAAAYVWSLLKTDWGSSAGRGLYAFSTNLNKNHGVFNIIKIER